MLNFTSYEENANQNYNNIPPHTCKNEINQKTYSGIIADEWGLGSMPEGLNLKREISEGAHDTETLSKETKCLGCSCQPRNPQ